jgi:PKHD-type hydroxylase
MSLDKNQIFFPAIVLDNQDPMCIGRIRVMPETESFDSINNPFAGFNEEKDKWSEKDPLVFLPLMPIHFFNVPEIKELVTVVYQNKDFKRENQFYIPGPYSSPMNIKFENYQGSKKFLASGSKNSKSLSLKDKNGQYRTAKSFGIFPEPGDNSIMGRGSTDLILKENEVLLRAGKTQVSNLNPTTFPVGNEYRAFVQLSNFTTTKVAGEPELIKTPQLNIQYVQRMLMWKIINLDNEQNAFTGSITLHTIYPTSPSVNTQNFKLDSIINLVVGTNYSSPNIIFNFQGKTAEEVSQSISLIANALFDGNGFDNPNYPKKFPLATSKKRSIFTKDKQKNKWGGLWSGHASAIIYINDDFKGGKFYLQNGHEKYYPPQSKGTVLVFPSFIMHGVEDVEDGNRYSVVCWMVGKFFK